PPARGVALFGGGARDGLGGPGGAGRAGGDLGRNLGGPPQPPADRAGTGRADDSRDRPDRAAATRTVPRPARVPRLGGGGAPRLAGGPRGAARARIRELTRADRRALAPPRNPAPAARSRPHAWRV